MFHPARIDNFNPQKPTKMSEILKFDLPRNQSSIIKVIGVGGGGSNAVNHMYRQGINGVDFIISNTDAQSMESSPVPTRIQLGATLTGGLGAGASPTVGRNAALENVEDIRKILEKGTKMVFITAGLGGGTGTGAAPVIAQVSKELGILTVGIVTIPFAFEGKKRRSSAEEGIRQLKEHVDALLIISNDKLRQLHGDLALSEAFNRADNILTTAAKGIAEIITVTGYINVDFEDVKTVMNNSGVAIMGNGIASGPERAKTAVELALNSPLLDNNDISGAGNILLYITSGTKEITMDEVTDITDFIQEKTKSTGDIIWGNGFDSSLEDKISVTLIATGFDEEHKQKDPQPPTGVKVIDLYDDQSQPTTTKRYINLDPEPGNVRPFAAPPAIQNPAPNPPVPVEMAEAENPSEPEIVLPEPAMAETDTVVTEEVKIPEVPEFPEEVISAEDPGQIEAQEITPTIGSPEPDPPRFQLEPEETPAKTLRTFEFVFKDQEITPQPERKPAPAFSLNREETEINPQKTEPATVHLKIQPPPETGNDPASIPGKKSGERINKLKELSEKLKNHIPIEQNLPELESIPAYQRRNVEIKEVTPSSSSSIARLDVSQDPEKPLDNKNNNPFLNPSTD